MIIRYLDVQGMWMFTVWGFRGFWLGFRVWGFGFRVSGLLHIVSEICLSFHIPFILYKASRTRMLILIRFDPMYNPSSRFILHVVSKFILRSKGCSMLSKVQVVEGSRDRVSSRSH